jgi:hypothetical protein
VARPERPVETWIIHLERFDRRTTNHRHADDEEEPMNEAEVIEPPIVSWVKEPIRAPSKSMHDAAPLRRVAKWAGPGVIVQMIRPAPTWNRHNAAKVASEILRPMRRGNDVVDLKAPQGGEQTVFTPIVGLEASGKSHQRIAGAVLSPSRQMLAERLGYLT